MPREGSPASIPLATTASRGAVMLATATGVSMAASAVAQIALGFLLAKSDFGVYGIAISLAVVFEVVREGGIGRYLSRLDRDEFSKFWSSALTFSLAVSIAAGGLLILLAQPASRLFGESQLTAVLVVIGLALPLNTARIVAIPKLQIDFRFGAVAMLQASSSVLRYALVIVFAVVGLGPLSFVLPLLVVGVYETAMSWHMSGLRIREVARRTTGFLGVLSRTGWALLGTVFHKLEPRAAFLALGLTIATEATGVLFFAFQLTFQIVFLFTGSMQRVVLPIFSKIHGDRESFGRAIIGACSSLALVAAPVFAAVVVFAGPTLDAIWSGKWHAAVLPVQVFAVALLAYLFAFVFESSLQSVGRFRLWTLIVMGGSGMIFLATMGAGIRLGSARTDGLAVVIAGTIVLLAIVEVVGLTKALAIDGMSLVAKTGPSLAYWLGLAGATLTIDNAAAQSYGDWVVPLVLFGLLGIPTGAILFRRDYGRLLSLLGGNFGLE